MIAYFAKNLSSTNINDRKGGIKALTSIGIALKDHVTNKSKIRLLLMRFIRKNMQEV